MAGIPPTIETDNEDVAWALQTADALWKRDERLDAIVWLRRAAQAAGDAEDDDRALVLARNAAELADWMNRAPPASSPSGRLPPNASTPPVARAARSAPSGQPPKQATDVDAGGASHAAAPRDAAAAHPGTVVADSGTSRRSGELHRQDDEATSPNMTLPVPTSPEPPPAPRFAGPAPSAAPALPSIVPTLKPARAGSAPPLPPLPTQRVPLDEQAKPGVQGEHVPTAAEVHAGMLDPWAENEPPAPVRERFEPPASRRVDGPSKVREPDEVVTSAPPVSQAAQRGGPPGTPSASAPHSARGAPPAPPPPPVVDPPPPSAGVARVDEIGIPHDWPDSSRRVLNRGVTVRELARDEEVSGFALVAVLAGEVDIAATIVDAPAERLRAGSMLRARGTIEATVPLRVIAATDGCRVATWSEKQVAQALASRPEVEEALRAAGNRIQALVGATMGPLGERLDTVLRTQVISRLRLRVVGEHEVLAKAGQAIPGLLVVGSGELEFLGKGGVPEGAVLRSGDFLFPSEVLRAAVAPHSVRGAKGGALVLMADRAVAQELLVTCPLLLEIFAEA